MAWVKMKSWQGVGEPKKGYNLASYKKPWSPKPAKTEAEEKELTREELVNQNLTMHEKADEVRSVLPTARTFNKDLSIDKVIGLPPNYSFGEPNASDDAFILSSMPIMAIYPAYPGRPDGKKVGLQTFHLKYPLGREKYETILKSAGIQSYSKTEHCIYVAFTNEASLSESFTSEYGESKFEQIGNIASSAAEELRYITGTASMGEAVKSVGQHMGAALGTLAGAAGTVAGWGEAALEKISGGTGVSKILTGSKIDFPQMWKGCSYSPSYSVSIRLYNYNPRDLNLHRKYIIEPLAKLLAFVVPISDSASTYSFPVLCSVSCPGLFMVKAAYVSSIEVIKGGDANNISFIQRPGIVDVKMTFNDLYGSMIAEDPASEPAKDPFRPTFEEYVQHLGSYSELPAGPGTMPIAVVTEEATVSSGGPVVETSNDPNTRTSDEARAKVEEILAGGQLWSQSI